jgi:hypothetical protein
MTLTDLANKLDKFAKSLPEIPNSAVRQAGSAILFDLTEATPADVGEAISNWQASLNVPAENVVPAFVPSPKGRMRNGVWTHTVDPQITRAANAPEAFAQGKEIISAKRPGEPLFITNNTVQIVPLDQGSSTQTPQGFVARAIIIGRIILDKIKVSL